MSTLINDLLAYSRVGTRGKQFEKVEMGSLREAVNNLEKVLDENHAAITSEELPVVTGDDTQLVQLLQNLIANGIKFRKKEVEPCIHVSIGRKGNEWVFGVRDNGIGIERRFFERIFTIFQRLHTKEEYAGTGVGLAICRRIVERAGASGSNRSPERDPRFILRCRHEARRPEAGRREAGEGRTRNQKEVTVTTPVS